MELREFRTLLTLSLALGLELGCQHLGGTVAPRLEEEFAQAFDAVVCAARASQWPQRPGGQRPDGQGPGGEGSGPQELAAAGS